MIKLLAQQSQSLGTIGSGNKGELGPFAGSSLLNPLDRITGYISSIVGMLTIFASIWFLFMLLFAGYEWISAGGDAKKIAAARDRITHAFVGLVIVVGSWSLLAVAGQFFGFDTLLGTNTNNFFIIK